MPLHAKLNASMCYRGNNMIFEWVAPVHPNAAQCRMEYITLYIFELHLCTVFCVPMLPTERLKATRLIADLVHFEYVREVSTRCFSGLRKVLIGAVYGYQNFLLPGRHKPQSLYRRNKPGALHISCTAHIGGAKFFTRRIQEAIYGIHNKLRIPGVVE